MIFRASSSLTRWASNYDITGNILCSFSYVLRAPLEEAGVLIFSFVN